MGALRDTIMRLLGGKAITATPYSARHGLRGCTERIWRENHFETHFTMCALPKGHAGDHLPSVRPAHGARV